MSNCNEMVPTTVQSNRSSIEKGINDTSTPIPPSTPTAVPTRSTFKSIVLVFTVTFAMFINLANSSATVISIPTIQSDLGLQTSQLQWIGCLLLVFGRVADVYGRKKTFIFGAFDLAVSTLASAFPKDFKTLASLRAMQGIGAAAMVPAGLGILAHAFPPSRARNLAFATFSSGAALGAVFGSNIGGVLTEFTPKEWRSPFYLLSALVAVILVSGLFSIDADLPSMETDKRVDWIGAFFVTTGLVLIIFVLGQGDIAPHIIALLIVGVIFLGLFLCWQYHLEKRFDDPKSTYSVFMPPPLMRISLCTRASGRLAAIMLIAFTAWCAFQSWTYWIQLYYQDYKQYTAMQTAVRLLPMFFSGILCNVFFGLMAAHIPLVWLIGVAISSTCMAVLLFNLSQPSMTYWPLEFPAIWLSVIAVDIIFSAGTLFIAKFALPHEQSMAGALFNTMIQLGTTFGITLSTFVFDSVTNSRSPDADMIVSYRYATWTSGAFYIIAFIIGIVSFRGVGAVGHRGPKTSSPDEEVSIPDSDMMELAVKKEDM
ncbi:MFS general substrate transporter [Phlegmacium glaucopus]|nr:MFS general substrate transporter [Phlegmacium glaucopus]